MRKPPKPRENQLHLFQTPAQSPALPREINQKTVSLLARMPKTLPRTVSARWLTPLLPQSFGSCAGSHKLQRLEQGQRADVLCLSLEEELPQVKAARIGRS